MSVDVTIASGVSVTVTEKGPKGNTGATGATGETGATGAAGASGKTYSVSCADGDNGDEEKIRLTDSDGTTDDVVLEAGTGLSIARSSDKITFTNTVSDTNTTYSAGDGLDLSGTTLTADLKHQGGLTIDSGELQVNLSDPSSAGTLPATKGGTGATSLTDGGVLFGNGGGVIQAVDLTSSGNIIVGGADPKAVAGATLAGGGLAATTGDGLLVLTVETLNQDTTGTAAVATAVTASDESSDTTCFPLFVTAATGDLAPKTGSNLAFNSSTGDLTAAGTLTAKTYDYISCGYFDDISTSLHYLPLNAPPYEMTSDGNAYSDWVAPCHTTVLSAQMRFTSLTGSGNMTMTVWKDPIGSGTKASVEAETVAISGSGDNNDVVHFLFDGAVVNKGEVMKITVQADADVTGSSNTFVTVVLLHDWSDRYTVSSAIIAS